MKIKNLLVIFLLTMLTSSCVSKTIFEEEQAKNESLAAQNEQLLSQLDGKENINTGSLSSEKLTSQLEKVTAEKTRAEMNLDATQNSYNRLKESYDALVANSDENLKEIFERNRKLLEQLEAKERALNKKEQDLIAKEERLLKAQTQLYQSAKRVAELERIIAAKDAKMRALKDAISAALSNFEGNGLTIEQRDGNVYVSMENKLLFASGSWDVNPQGQEAVVALGKVLGENKEIAVLIEGHTDNVPYGEKGLIKNNWDLSTKRATAIVSILTQNEAIPKENLTAAGRGQYAPLTTNATKEGRAKNRRIEVILTPKLDEISKLLNDM